MQKIAPSVGRLAIIGIFALSCVGLLLFLWISFGGSVPLQAKGYRFNIIFPQANQLSQQADVRISGVTVGTVVALRPTAHGQTLATIQLRPRYAPVHSDARAILRAKTLLGETFVALTPGSRTAPAIPEGGTLGLGQVAPSVQLDEIYRVFDPRTRAAFQLWLQASAAGVAGDGAALNAAVGELDPFVNDLQQVTATLQSQNGDVAALVRNTGVVLNALTQREHQLRNLILTSRETFNATSDANIELASAFAALPLFERRAQVTLRRLDTFSADASPLVAQLTPVAIALTPALRQLRAVSPNLAHLAAGLGPLTQASRSGLPALDDVLGQLRPLLGALSPVLRNLNPLLAYGDLYQPEVEAFFANGAATGEAATTVANEALGNTTSLHYVRGLAGPLNPSSLSWQSSPYGANRANAYAAPGAFNRLANGLLTLDTASCTNPTPGVAGPANATVSQDTLGLITALGIAGSGSAGGAAAPPCNGQPAQTFAGLTSTFPQVRAADR